MLQPHCSAPASTAPQHHARGTTHRFLLRSVLLLLLLPLLLLGLLLLLLVLVLVLLVLVVLLLNLLQLLLNVCNLVFKLTNLFVPFKDLLLVFLSLLFVLLLTLVLLQRVPRHRHRVGHNYRMAHSSRRGVRACLNPRHHVEVHRSRPWRR